jgi:hypothetical protein
VGMKKSKHIIENSEKENILGVDINIFESENDQCILGKSNQDL